MYIISTTICDHHEHDVAHDCSRPPRHLSSFFLLTFTNNATLSIFVIFSSLDVHGYARIPTLYWGWSLGGDPFIPGQGRWGARWDYNLKTIVNRPYWHNCVNHPQATKKAPKGPNRLDMSTDELENRDQLRYNRCRPISNRVTGKCGIVDQVIRSLLETRFCFVLKINRSFFKCRVEFSSFLIFFVQFIIHLYILNNHDRLNFSFAI